MKPGSVSAAPPCKFTKVKGTFNVIFSSAGLSQIKVRCEPSVTAVSLQLLVAHKKGARHYAMAAQLNSAKLC